MFFKIVIKNYIDLDRFKKIILLQQNFSFKNIFKYSMLFEYLRI